MSCLQVVEALQELTPLRITFGLAGALLIKEVYHQIAVHVAVLPAYCWRQKDASSQSFAHTHKQKEHKTNKAQKKRTDSTTSQRKGKKEPSHTMTKKMPVTRFVQRWLGLPRPSQLAGCRQHQHPSANTGVYSIDQISAINVHETHVHIPCDEARASCTDKEHAYF